MAIFYENIIGENNYTNNNGQENKHFSIPRIQYEIKQKHIGSLVLNVIDVMLRYLNCYNIHSSYCEKNAY